MDGSGEQRHAELRRMMWEDCLMKTSDCRAWQLREDPVAVTWYLSCAQRMSCQMSALGWLVTGITLHPSLRLAHLPANTFKRTLASCIGWPRNRVGWFTDDWYRFIMRLVHVSFRLSLIKWWENCDCWVNHRTKYWQSTWKYRTLAEGSYSTPRRVIGVIKQWLRCNGAWVFRQCSSGCVKYSGMCPSAMTRQHDETKYCPGHGTVRWLRTGIQGVGQRTRFVSAAISGEKFLTKKCRKNMKRIIADYCSAQRTVVRRRRFVRDLAIRVQWWWHRHATVSTESSDGSNCGCSSDAASNQSHAENRSSMMPHRRAMLLSAEQCNDQHRIANSHCMQKRLRFSSSQKTDAEQ